MAVAKSIHVDSNEIVPELFVMTETWNNRSPQALDSDRIEVASTSEGDFHNTTRWGGRLIHTGTGRNARA